MNNTQLKINNIYQMLCNRLPQSYIQPIQQYDNVDNALVDVAKKYNYNIDNIKNIYTQYIICSNQNCTYKRRNNIFRHKYSKHTATYLDIVALADNPIRIVTPQLENENNILIAATILHEFGHWFAKNKYGEQKYHDEKFADNFAIRWVHKLKRERLI